jgi:hypothetical protein
MAEHAGVLLYFAPRSAISRRDTQEDNDDSQTLPRFHFFADLLLSHRIDAFFQSKEGIAHAEIAHDA